MPKEVVGDIPFHLKFALKVLFHYQQYELVGQSRELGLRKRIC